MIRLYFNAQGNLVLKIFDADHVTKLVCNQQEKPIEKLINFFLNCCKTDLFEKPDFSQGVKPGIQCVFLSGNINLALICNHSLIAIQEKSWKQFTRRKTTVFTGFWEYYCYYFIEECTEHLLIEYCVRWSDKKEGKRKLTKKAKEAIAKLEELQDEFINHCERTGIEYRKLQLINEREV